MKKALLMGLVGLGLVSQLSANDKWLSEEQSQMFKEMNEMFNNRMMALKNQYGSSMSDETNDAFVYEFDMPGLEKSDVKMEIVNNVLLIKGEKKKETGNGVSNSRNYSYSMTLPKNSDAEKITAVMKNGILKVVVSKKEIKEEKRKSIEIK